jgi:endonuclease-3
MRVGKKLSNVTGRLGMVAAHKQRTLNKLLTILSRNYSVASTKDITVLEHLILGVVQEGMGFSKAIEAFETLMANFHDHNEMRVSHADEIAEAIPDTVPDRSAKAKRIQQILQFVFETTYSYDLEQMKKKPLRQAQKQLSKIQGTTPFIVNAVVQRSLGGHALPVDDGMIALLKQLHIAEEDDTGERIQADLEHLIPKAKGLAFSIQLSELAGDSPKKQKTLLKDLLTSAPKTKAVKTTSEDDAKPVKKTPEKKSVKKK